MASRISSPFPPGPCIHLFALPYSLICHDGLFKLRITSGTFTFDFPHPSPVFELEHTREFFWETDGLVWVGSVRIARKNGAFKRRRLAFILEFSLVFTIIPARCRPFKAPSHSRDETIIV